ncbi:helix-turn-helix transcriptional regulator [Phenylobacterium sp.]|uniref:helix-turn-helix domain-containing protein n=1 Tax=Phenylobacterium sp. TaxID=1871053 RepID=UPI0025D2D43C|nr:helix-turn-helix transcriptional regulator [Phenylobacterium sp.]
MSTYPAIIQYLGREPWAEPQSLGAALLAERRRRGIEVLKAAALVGVGEGTWRRWERGEWKPGRQKLPALDQLLGYTIAERFPSEVR